MKIDKEDRHLLKKYKWYQEKGKGYYKTWTKDACLYLHKLVMGNPKCPVDHINRDTTDNRKINLRLCTSQENSCNRKIQENNKTGCSGINLTPHGYRVRIGYQNERLHLGYYKRLKDAKIIRKEAVKRFHGVFGA